MRRGTIAEAARMTPLHHCRGGGRAHFAGGHVLKGAAHGVAGEALGVEDEQVGEEVGAEGVVEGPKLAGGEQTPRPRSEPGV